MIMNTNVDIKETRFHDILSVFFSEIDVVDDLENQEPVSLGDFLQEYERTYGLEGALERSLSMSHEDHERIVNMISLRKVISIKPCSPPKARFFWQKKKKGRLRDFENVVHKLRWICHILGHSDGDQVSLEEAVLAVHHLFETGFLASAAD